MLNVLLGSNLLSAIVAFALVLIPAIIIHEFGHFLMAKAVGITILEFGIGFPPRITRLFSWGETDVTLNWLPIGGFVRPLGEDLIRPLGEEAVEQERQQLQSARRADPVQQERSELEARGVKNIVSVYEAKPVSRIIFMVGGALANFLSAFMLFIVIGLMGIPKDVGARVQLLQIPPDSALSAAGVQANDQIEALNGERFIDSETFFADLSASIGQAVTLTIRRPETDEVFDVTFTPTASDLPTEKPVRVLGVAEGSPAEKAGLQADDLIIAFNNKSITSTEDPTTELRNLTDETAGQVGTLTVLRDGKQLEIQLVPRIDPPASEGRMGISIWSEYHSAQSFGSALQYGIERTGSVFGLIAEVPSRLIKGTLTPEETRPISVIGISQMGGQVLQRSIEENQPMTILNYVAVISILLGVTNLLPLPALDGGRILFVLIEIVRGRPISPEKEGLVHLIGFAFILSIGIFFMLNDIINPLPNILP
jgi:regulator of sigma E protease